MNDVVENIKSFYKNHNKEDFNVCIDNIIEIVNDNTFEIKDIRDVISAFCGIDAARNNEMDRKMLEGCKKLGEILKEKIIKDFRDDRNVDVKSALDLIDRSGSWYNKHV